MEKEQIKLIPGNRNPKKKGKRSLRKTDNRRTGLDAKYAYVFKDPSVGEMPVLNTANAWWKESVKLYKLVEAYKFYATDDEACFFAGITIDQLKYFQELHTYFYTIKHACKQDPTLRAKKTLIKSIDKNSEDAKWWLSRIQKETFSPRIDVVGANGRELFDGLAQEMRQLGEIIRNDDGNNNETKTHPADNNASVDAGQDGNRHEAGTANADGKADSVPVVGGETVQA